MNKLLVVISLIVITVGAVVLIQKNSGLIEDLGHVIGDAVNSPQPEWSSLASSIHESSPGGNYTVWVDCAIRNFGGNGDVTVIAILTVGNNSWEQQQELWMSGDTEHLFRFQFSEVTFIGSLLAQSRYLCRAN
jgi:hypothetical protein